MHMGNVLLKKFVPMRLAVTNSVVKPTTTTSK
jgi:hypothetical protein